MFDFASKRVTVMGLGNFGGGLGVTRWLVSQGADVLVTDASPPEKLESALAELRPLIDAGEVTTRLGEHNVSDFTGADAVIANPAVPMPWDNRFLRAARAAGVHVTTEIRLLVERLPSRDNVIGITGSAGKSTTTAMIAHALKAMNEPVVVGGNLGGSLLYELATLTTRHRVVLELSSAMLHWLDAGADGPGFSPRVAVVTNIKPNHIDWHGSFDHYAASKRVIAAHQRPGDTLILGDDSPAAPPGSWPEVPGVSRRAPARAAPEFALRLPGSHNRLNAVLAADAVAAALSTDPREQAAARAGALRALADFPGLEHRLQFIGEFPVPGGAGFAFNDSKSTTPESAATAIEALDGDPRYGADRVHLIAGGYDKKIDLAPMIAPASRCAAVYTIGATGPSIAAGVAVAGGRATECSTLDRAFNAARAAMRDREVLLLSPGCASWDQYVNFERRGEEFVRLVRSA